MPFISSQFQDIPTFINPDHIVGMQIVLSKHNPEAVVKVLAARSELDLAFKFQDEDEAKDFILALAEYCKKSKYPMHHINAQIA